jgi:hypothetical protein
MIVAGFGKHVLTSTGRPPFMIAGIAYAFPFVMWK